MPLLVVRHADAISRSSWDEDDDLARPLSQKGFRQAKLLPELLSAYMPARIVSSPALRCMDTVTPLGEALGLPVEVDERLFEGSPAAAAIEMVRSMAGEDAAICSHGDIIPPILKAVSQKDKVSLGKHPRFEKASVWVLDGGSKRYRSARYLPPPEV